jgi:hypothetical protein
MAALPNSLPDADGLNNEACPVANGRGEPAASNPGPVPYQAGPTPTTDGALYLAAEIIWPEIWPARHNHEVWKTGPDGTCGESWKNDATAWSFDE